MGNLRQGEYKGIAPVCVDEGVGWISSEQRTLSLQLGPLVALQGCREQGLVSSPE